MYIYNTEERINPFTNMTGNKETICRTYERYQCVCRGNFQHVMCIAMLEITNKRKCI